KMDGPHEAGHDDQETDDARSIDTAHEQAVASGASETAVAMSEKGAIRMTGHNCAPSGPQIRGSSSREGPIRVGAERVVGLAPRCHGPAAATQFKSDRAIADQALTLACLDFRFHLAQTSQRERLHACEHIRAGAARVAMVLAEIGMCFHLTAEPICDLGGER